MYNCELCGYKTDRKFSFERHQSSNKHKLITSQKLAELASLHNDLASLHTECAYICKKCHQVFKHSSSLARHNKKRHKSLQKDTIEKLDAKFDELLLIIKEQNHEIRMLKQNQQSRITQYNYIHQNFSRAPPLIPIEDVKFMDYNNETELLDNLEHHYNNDTLSAFLGDYMIKHYKKANPKEQSMWNTDKSRYNYSISTLTKDNKTCWEEDGEAKQIRKRIIKPILETLDKQIRKQIDELNETVQENDGVGCHHELQRMEKLAKIQTEIRYGKLAKKIIKYITPDFHLDQTGFLIERQTNK